MWEGGWKKSSGFRAERAGESDWNVPAKLFKGQSRMAKTKTDMLDAYVLGCCMCICALHIKSIRFFLTPLPPTPKKPVVPPWKQRCPTESVCSRFIHFLDSHGGQYHPVLLTFKSFSYRKISLSPWPHTKDGTGDKRPECSLPWTNQVNPKKDLSAALGLPVSHLLQKRNDFLCLVYLCCAKGGQWMSSINVTWVLVQNSESQAPPWLTELI